MPAIGQCCAERGINADGIGAGTGKDSQNLLAAVDEGITFLRGKYRSIALETIKSRAEYYFGKALHNE